VTLLVFLAIPSFFALCFLAVAHTFQTMNLRLSVESATFPSDLLREYFPAPPAFQTAQAVPARARSYERLLQNYISRASRPAFSSESGLPRFMRLPASFLREYRRDGPESSFRVMSSTDAKFKSAARAAFPRRRARLSALTRRPRSFSSALMSYS
jgi:hypothetical protein